MTREFLSAYSEIPGLSNVRIGDFWSWAFSDILDNRTRSIFAEFLVGSALNTLNCPRREWDAYDLDFRGWKIEVKSAGFIQSWKTGKLSRISFDIARKRAWFANTNTYSDGYVRSADCYVFCLLAERDPAKLNVFDTSQWRFWLLTKQYIDRELGNQKTISLSRLRAIAEEVPFDQLRSRLGQLLEVR
jgi:hypothetical protein